MPRERELHDKYFKLAKQEGYVARSAYKLLEIQERKHVLRRGNWVLDVGCAPGSWLQVASKIVGDNGRIVGIDLQEVTIPPLANVRTAVADAFATSPATLLAMVNGEPPAPAPGDEHLPPPPPQRFDVVLSDMAPSTTGTPMADHFRSVDCCRRVMTLAESVLAPGGKLVMKVFEGESYPDLLKDVQLLFREIKGLRPDAVRDLSREIFIMGFGYGMYAGKR